MGQDEKRKFSRYGKQCMISFYIVEESGEKKEEKGVVVDGSQAGVRFKVKNSLKKNTRIYIKLDAEEWGEELTYLCQGDEPGLVEVIGSVMWCLESQNSPGEYEVGTRFISQVEH